MQQGTQAGAPAAAAGRGPRYASNADIPFYLVTQMWERVVEIHHQQKGARDKKHGVIRRFMQTVMNRDSPDTFQVVRLLCPDRDRVRGNYQMKEATLAHILARACGLPPKSEAERQLVEYKKNVTQKHISGHFHTAAYNLLLKSWCGIVESDAQRAMQLTVGELNDDLDQLADPSLRAADSKLPIFRRLLQRTTGTMMKWIVCIILGDVQIGVNSPTITKLYHPDAEDMWSLTQDLAQICDKLRDLRSRMQRRDVEPGCAVDPMKAERARAVDEAFRMMQGAPYVVEIKLDGERLIVHRSNNVDDVGNKRYDIKYTSRRGLEHSSRRAYCVLDECVRQQVVSDNIMLDGEIIVWNKTRCKFEPFGTVLTTAQAAMDASPPTHQIVGQGTSEVFTSDPTYVAPTAAEVELLYVAFDILYTGQESHIRQPLSMRQLLLSKAIKEAPPDGYVLGAPGSSVRGRIVPLLPDQPTFMGQPVTFSVKSDGRSANVLQDMFDQAVQAGEEGVVVKRLDSAWSYGKRTKDWIKLKPDYIQNQDVDAVIIGGIYGKGTRVGQLHEFILGLPVPNPKGGPPVMFESFCKVGQGLTDADYRTLRELLQPAGFIDARDPKSVPKMYKVTGKEKPDVWIADVNKSIVLEVHADVRAIVTKQFATRYSLRFPRIERIRHDKGPAQCNTSAELEAMMIRALERNKEGDAGEGALDAHGLRSRRAHKHLQQQLKGAKAQRNRVPYHLQPTDTTDIPVVVNALAGRKVCCKVYGNQSKQSVAVKVKQLGGQVQMNLPQGRDLSIIVVAAEMSRVLEAEVRRGWYDVLRLSWLDDCLEIGEYLEPSPWHYLYMKPETRQLRDHHDMHGDPWFEDLDEAGRDMQQLLNVLLDQQQLQQFAWYYAVGLSLNLRKVLTDKQLLQQLQAQLEKADKQQAKQREAVLAGNGEQESQVMNRQSLIDDIDQQLEELGQPRAATSLLHGKVVYFLDMWASGSPGSKEQEHSNAETSSGADNLSRLEGVADVEEVADKWQTRLHTLQLEELRIQVKSHGGEVQTQLAPGVTHIVLLPPEVSCLPPSNADSTPPLEPQSQQLVSTQQLLLQLHEAAQSAAAASLTAAASRAVAASKEVVKPKGSRAKPVMKVASTQLPSDLAGLPTQVIESVAQGADEAGTQASALAAQRAKRLLAHIRKRLLDGRIAMVHPSWVTSSCAASPTSTITHKADGSPAAQHAPWVAGPQQPQQPAHPGAPTSHAVDTQAGSAAGRAEGSRASNSKSRSTVTAELLQAARPTQAARPSLFMLDDEDDEDLEPPAAPHAIAEGADGIQHGVVHEGGGGGKQWSVGALPLYSAWPWSLVGLADGAGQGDTTCSSVVATTTATDSGSEGGRAAKSQRGRGAGRGGRGRGRGGKRAGAAAADHGTEGGSTAPKATRKRAARTVKESEEEMPSQEDSGGERATKARKPRGRGRARGRGGRGRGASKAGGEDGDVDESGAEEVATKGRQSASTRRSRPPGYQGMNKGNTGKRPRVGPAEPTGAASDHVAVATGTSTGTGTVAQQQFGGSNTATADHSPAPAVERGVGGHTLSAGVLSPRQHARGPTAMEHDAGVLSDSGPSYHTGDLKDSSSDEMGPSGLAQGGTSTQAGIATSSKPSGGAARAPDMGVPGAEFTHLTHAPEPVSLVPQTMTAAGRHKPASLVPQPEMASKLQPAASSLAAGVQLPVSGDGSIGLNRMVVPVPVLPSQAAQPPVSAKKKNKLFLLDSDEEEEAEAPGIQDSAMPADTVGASNAAALPTFPVSNTAHDSPLFSVPSTGLPVTVTELQPAGVAGAGPGLGTVAGGTGGGTSGTGQASGSTQPGGNKASAADFLAKMGWLK